MINPTNHSDKTDYLYSLVCIMLDIYWVSHTPPAMDPVTAHPYLSEEQQRELHIIAAALSRPGGGILVPDETPKAMEARFSSLKIDNTPEVDKIIIEV